MQTWAGLVEDELLRGGMPTCRNGTRTHGSRRRGTQARALGQHAADDREGLRDDRSEWIGRSSVLRPRKIDQPPSARRRIRASSPAPAPNIQTAPGKGTGATTVRTNS